MKPTLEQKPRLRSPRRFYILLTLLLPVLFVSCRDEVDVAPVGGGTGSGTLLINSSFELGGNPSFSGWIRGDSSLVGFSGLTPPDGGQWSVSIASSSGPGASIYSLLPATTGTYVYRLTVWGKATGKAGRASIITRNSFPPVEVASTAVEDTVWTVLSLLDTITTNPGDSIGVKLSGAISEIVPQSVFFDLCTLEQF